MEGTNHVVERPSSAMKRFPRAIIAYHQYFYHPNAPYMNLPNCIKTETL